MKIDFNNHSNPAIGQKSISTLNNQDLMNLVSSITNETQNGKFSTMDRCVISSWSETTSSAEPMTLVKVRFQVWGGNVYGYGRIYNYVCHRAKDFSCWNIEFQEVEVDENGVERRESQKI